MQFYEAVVLAFNSIKSHKLRSFLTLLGVIVGVITVVGVASFINSVNAYVGDTVINDFGANTVTLDKYGIINGFDEWIEASRRNKDITQDDYRALQEGVTLAQHSGIVISSQVDVLRHGNLELRDVAVNGETSSMADIMTNGTTVAHGRFITETDNEQRRNVVFIGSKVRDKFFPNTEPIGKELKIKGIPFEIIGVAKEIGSTFGQERDIYAVIPFETHLKMFGLHQSLTIYFKAINPGAQEALQDQIRTIMRSRRHLRFSEKDNFGFVSAEAIIEFWNSLTGLIAVVALAVTSISLVVGGIVIMNIMMVAVTERTREIGIRKSLGARRRDILWQFLIEAAMLSSSGGMIGLLLVWLGTLIASAFAFSVTVPIWAIVTSLTVSIGVGLIFGMYPAVRAANLDPITALRYE
ncbi:MAG: ABC transporter permease [Blastocatellia bacterium]|nr:ABC transporter permease [Blastocatellia bacterium]